MKLQRTIGCKVSFGGCFVMLSLLTACTVYGVTHSKAPDSVFHPPVYPGAQQTSYSTDQDGSIFIKLTTFDRQENVFQFYDKTLQEEGWYRCESEYYTSGACLGVTDGIVFQWKQASVDGPTTLGYRFTVVATDTVTMTAQTLVQIDVTKFNPLSADGLKTPFPRQYQPSPTP